jgi:hypothetical protein
MYVANNDWFIHGHVWQRRGAGFSSNKGFPRRGTGVARQECVYTVDGTTILYSLYG